MYKAEEMIKQAIDRYGEHCAIACSFGKASTVVLHMALKINPGILVVFGNTLCQPKETYDYKERIVSEWGVNLIETKPYKGMNFWKCLEKYGLPGSRKSGGKGANAPRCCHYLKEKPAEILYKQSGVKAVITGIMAEENRNRRLLAMRYDNYYRQHDDIEMCAQRYYAKTQGMWKIHPIIYWSQADLTEYYRANNIPLNEFYTKWNNLYPRSGCLPCTAYKSWEERLSISHPKLYARLKRIEQAKKEEQGNGFYNSQQPQEENFEQIEMDL
jgi:phosphoadenosine phosphosulfate reductase